MVVGGWERIWKGGKRTEIIRCKIIFLNCLMLVVARGQACGEDKKELIYFWVFVIEVRLSQKLWWKKIWRKKSESVFDRPIFVRL